MWNIYIFNIFVFNISNIISNIDIILEIWLYTNWSNSWGSFPQSIFVSSFVFFLQWISYLPTVSTHFLNSIIYPKLFQTCLTCFTTKNKRKNNLRYFAVLLGTHPRWRVCGQILSFYIFWIFSPSSFTVVILFIWNTAGFICFSLLVPSLLI